MKDNPCIYVDDEEESKRNLSIESNRNNYEGLKMYIVIFYYLMYYVFILDIKIMLLHLYILR